MPIVANGQAANPWDLNPNMYAALSQPYFDPNTGLVNMPPAAGQAQPAVAMTSGSQVDTGLQDAHDRYQLGNAAIAGGAQAIQTGGLMLQTTADKHNKDRLAELKEEQKRGFGMDEDQKAYLRRVSFDAPRAMAAEAADAAETRLSAGGGTTSAAAATKAGREERRDVQQLAQQSGMEESRQNIEAAAAKTRELEERIVARGERQKEIIGHIGTLASAGAGIAGTTRAGKTLEALDTTKLEGSPAEIALMLKMARRDPEMAESLVNLYGTNA